MPAVSDRDQVEYARLRALVELRMQDLHGALDRHEASGRWGEHEFLARVEAALADLLAELAEP